MTDFAGKAPQKRMAITTGSPDLFELFRDAMSRMFRWELPRGLTPAGFLASAAGVDLESFTFSTSTTTGGDLVRDRRVLAHSGMAPILLQVYRTDPYAFVSGRQSAVVKPGDVAVFDLARPLAIEAPRVNNVTVTVQRAVIQPLVARMDTINGRVLPGRTRYARLLTHHIQTFALRYAELDPDEVAVLSAATPGLVAACLGPSEDGREPARAAVRLAVFNLIREEIDRRLADPDMDAEAIQAGFGLSRSALYRLFEPFGGVARYIAGRRLARIHTLLRDPASRHRTVSEIAASLGYGNPSAFSRAFHRHYGVTPRDVRASALRDDDDDLVMTGEPRLFQAIREWTSAF